MFLLHRGHLWIPPIIDCIIVFSPARLVGDMAKKEDPRIANGKTEIQRLRAAGKTTNYAKMTAAEKAAYRAATGNKPLKKAGGPKRPATSVTAPDLPPPPRNRKWKTGGSF